MRVTPLLLEHADLVEERFNFLAKYNIFDISKWENLPENAKVEYLKIQVDIDELLKEMQKGFIPK
jgi:hypothetical protein